MSLNLNINDTENLFYKLLDNADLLVFYFDVHGKISMCNKKTREATGRSKEDILGKYWLEVLSRDESTAMKQQMLKAVIEDSVTYKRPNIFESVVVDVGNNERFISWSISPIQSESGELEGVLLVGNEVTEGKEREAS